MLQQIGISVYLQGKTCQMVINLVVVEFVEEHRKCSYRRFKGHRSYRMHTDYNIKPINQPSLGQALKSVVVSNGRKSGGHHCSAVPYQCTGCSNF